MTVHELLADLRRQGFHLTPLPGDRLEVRPFSKLSEALRQELKQRKAEVLELLSRQLEPFPWPCPHCGSPAEIEAVEPRQSDGVLLTYWQCPPCQTWAVSPATLREPPIWVSKRAQ
jgi:hypothetical protein